MKANWPRRKNMETIIQCKDLVKVYTMGSEKVHALNGIDLEVKRGEFIALLGKSGSGKSTLLNMLAGLEKPTSGEVMINEHHLEKLSETKITNIRKKHVGFIFQSYNLLPTHTALENVMLPLVFNGMKKKKRVARAKEMLELVGLGDRIHHKPSEMSGGQQQRVSIARAFVNNPEIVFADEPTGNLDTNTTEEVMELMLRLIKENNQTFIMVTHDPETSEYANKVVHMKDGIIEQIIHRENEKHEEHNMSNEKQEKDEKDAISSEKHEEDATNEKHDEHTKSKENVADEIKENDMKNKQKKEKGKE